MHRFVKNFWLNLNLIGAFILMNATFLFVTIFAIPLNTMLWLALLLFSIVDIPAVVVFLLLRKKILTFVYITDSNITLRYLSKSLCSFEWKDFDCVEFGYYLKCPEVRFCKINGDSPFVAFQLTRKNLLILKELEAVHPNVKEQITKTNLPVFGVIKRD